MDIVKWTDYINRVSCKCCDRGVGSDIETFNQAKTDPSLCTFESNRVYGPHLGFLLGCKRVLDIGCGVAHGVKYLRDKGIDAQGITADTNEIIQSKERLGLDIIQGDMHELPFPDNSFDGVYFWDSLEHAVSPIIALWEAQRVLVSGGRLIVEMDDEHGIIEPSHYYVPNVAQMRELFIHSRFKIDRIRQWGTWGGNYECHAINSKFFIKGLKMEPDKLQGLRLHNRGVQPIHYNDTPKYPICSVNDNF